MFLLINSRAHETSGGIGLESSQSDKPFVFVKLGCFEFLEYERQSWLLLTQFVRFKKVRGRFCSGENLNYVFVNLLRHKN